MTNIAIAQFAPGDDVRANLEHMLTAIDQAAAQGADLVVFPEYSMFTQDHVGPAFVETAQPVDGAFGSALATHATETGMHIVFGMNELVPGEERIFNTVVALAPGRGVVGTYRKVHLYDAFGYKESSWVKPAEETEAVVFDCAGTMVGLQTCYDLRFPEITRTLVDAGAELIAVPAEWVPGPLKEDHWTTLVRARAIENTVYVAAADQAAPNGAGNSLIVDPLGIVVANLGERTAVVTASIEKERIAEVRAKNPALELRRYSVVPIG